MVSAKEVFIDYYLIDFIILIILIVVWTYLNRINPKHLYIPKGDSRNSYPHYNSGITETQNLLYVVGIPYGIYILIYILFKAKCKINYFREFDFLLTILLHMASITISNIIANIIKIQVGRPRPDFFAVLGENATAESMCPEEMTRKTFNEEFKSFPSGHSATAMSGSLFLILFLMNGITVHNLWIKILILCLFLYPFIIGCTRITEHRHHTDDVIMGFFIGAIFPIIFFISDKDVIFRNIIFP